MAAHQTEPNHQLSGWPRGIPYIIGNEGCERFSYYGMKAILFVYLSQLLSSRGVELKSAEHQATDVVHTFIAGVYALPMVGAIIADRLLGKYLTILVLSMVYCAGHVCLALFEHNYTGFATGLVLIAVGAGGIKPCVSAHVGDQFGRANLHRIERVYQAFYFIINFGSLLSTLLIPYLRKEFGYGVAFGLPGLLMALATLVFWLGRNEFVHVPAQPGGKLGLLDSLSGIFLFMVIALPMFGADLIDGYRVLEWPARVAIALVCLALGLAVFVYRNRIQQDDGFLAVLWIGARSRLAGQGGFFDEARARFGEEAVEGPKAVLRILSVFVLVSIFWALFDQHSSSWIGQAREMDRTFHLFGYELSVLPEQIQAANPALVMLLVPLMAYVVYPGLAKLGLKLSPLTRMTLGMFLASLSFVIVALAQARIDAGERVHVGVQLLAFVVLTTAEVMVSVTGLEFAYTQAPKRMKSLLMGFWLLAVALGNILVAALARFESLPRERFFWLFAGLMLGAALLFGLRAAFYRYRTFTQ